MPDVTQLVRFEPSHLSSSLCASLLHSSASLPLREKKKDEDNAQVTDDMLPSTGSLLEKV